MYKWTCAIQKGSTVQQFPHLNFIPVVIQTYLPFSYVNSVDKIKFFPIEQLSKYNRNQHFSSQGQRDKSRIQIYGLKSRLKTMVTSRITPALCNCFSLTGGKRGDWGELGQCTLYHTHPSNFWMVWKIKGNHCSAGQLWAKVRRECLATLGLTFG